MSGGETKDKAVKEAKAGRLATWINGEFLKESLPDNLEFSLFCQGVSSNLGNQKYIKPIFDKIEMELFNERRSLQRRGLLFLAWHGHMTYRYVKYLYMTYL